MKLTLSETQGQRLVQLAAGLRKALSGYCHGFTQPLERWPVAQRALPLLLSLSAVWWSCARLSTAVEVSGREARQHALAMLEQKVMDAQGQAGRLPALRARARALGAGDAPESVPDNSALLRIISAAVDKSGVSLEMFEPAQATLTALQGRDGGDLETVEEIILHLKAAGTYSHLLLFAEALSALPQPFIATQAQLIRVGNDRETIDATVRVIGEPIQKNMLYEANDLISGSRSRQVLAEMADPFSAAGPLTSRPAIGMAHADQAADQQPVGSFQLGMRRAVLLHRGDGWHLVPVGADSPMPQVDPRSAALDIVSSQTRVATPSSAIGGAR